MTPIQVPYLCGGTLFSLLLQARKTRTKARDKFNGGSDGLKETDVMMGLVEVVTGDSFDSSQGKTFAKATSQFKTCQEYGPTYIPFTEPSVISAFNDSIKQKSPDLLIRMSEFIKQYINEMRSEWLVKALIEVIQKDDEIPEGNLFSISLEREVARKEFDSITDVELPMFLLSVIGFILNERKDNTKGRSTFEAWHTQSGSQSPWKYKATVGSLITRSIAVKTEYEIPKPEVADSDTPEKSATERINDHILAAGQALADAWGNAMQNLADELDGKSATNTKAGNDIGINKVELPQEQPSDEYPYSPEDKALLQEFTSDYDEVMLALIGENYGAALIDMTLPGKIQNLYKTKWCSKADTFQNPILKSHVFGLLGELNQLSNSFASETSDELSIKSIRLKIRNLYVKLHPDQYSGSFPYDAFVDDWEEGEF